MFTSLSPPTSCTNIKGAFKDHLVEWVTVYVTRHHPGAAGKVILDDIDRRYAHILFPPVRVDEMPFLG